MQFHDYAFTEADKANGYILLCSNRALTDLTIEASEAINPDDIPLQTTRGRVRRIERVASDTLVLHLRTPRLNTLRFLAGQNASLTAKTLAPHTTAIASCPCDSMNLQFHMRYTSAEPFPDYVFNELKLSDVLVIAGPQGRFVLDDESQRPHLFIAQELGFAPIKSLIEHALSLEKTQPIHLVWISNTTDGHYLQNFCRALADAMDNFVYVPLAAADAQPETVLARLRTQETPLADMDIYAAGDQPFLNSLRPPLLDAGAIETRLRIEQVDATGRVVS
jgi:CDP-4-dehydro-6-deoxyglucose reductase